MQSLVDWLHTDKSGFFLGPGRDAVTRRLAAYYDEWILPRSGPRAVTRRLLHTTRVFFLGPGRVQSLVDWLHTDEMYSS